ncbi:MAG: hypothetical protein ACRELY_17325, partial [Polyangiaceae bacterium]
MKRVTFSVRHSAFAGLCGLVAAAANIGACYSGDGPPMGQSAQQGPGTESTDSGIPFSPDAPSVYVPKVKQVLTGFPATDAG